MSGPYKELNGPRSVKRWSLTNSNPLRPRQSRKEDVLQNSLSFCAWQNGESYIKSRFKQRRMRLRAETNTTRERSRRPVQCAISTQASISYHSIVSGGRKKEKRTYVTTELTISSVTSISLPSSSFARQISAHISTVAIVIHIVSYAMSWPGQTRRPKPNATS